jgi:hypothetical protein
MAAESLTPAVGATLGTVREPYVVLLLRVDDPGQESGFEDVAVVYRSGLFRYEYRAGYTQRYVPGSACSS